MKTVALALCLVLSFVSFSQKSLAAVYQLPEKQSRLLGETLQYQVEQGDYFQAIAEYHNVGFLALMAANQGVDPFLPPVGALLNIPKQMLLPFAEHKGIVINLSELRLYYFPPNESLVYVFPVGIGRQGLSTPKIISFIGDKRKDPTWTPTTEMRARYLAKYGKELAKVIAAGPNNPFGKYALRIGSSEYLIHGSNKRFGIGMRASSGCIRLYDQDIAWLFNNIAIGTQVRIVDQAVKMSYELTGDKLIEVHQPLSEQTAVNAEYKLDPAINAFLSESDAAHQQYNELVKQPTGLVTKIIFEK